MISTKQNQQEKLIDSPGCSGVNLKNLLVDSTNADEIAEHLRIIVAGSGFRWLPEKVSISDLKPFMRGVSG